MKRIAILVIAATNQPVYRHYLRNYWTELIEFTRYNKRHIDVFLLFENAVDTREFEHLKDNIIQDVNSDLSTLCRKEYHGSGIPGILSKTIYAFESLQDRYDVYFRTNLSSVIRLSAFDQFVQSKETICYSGSSVWDDGLRRDLLSHKKVGPNRSIKSMSELNSYEGNTFISGSGYFLSDEEVRGLVERKGKIRYDIIDDVSVGLMFSKHEFLNGFSVTVTPDKPVPGMIELIRGSKACHVRLQHFPLAVAEAFWWEFRHSGLWG